MNPSNVAARTERQAPLRDLAQHLDRSLPGGLDRAACDHIRRVMDGRSAELLSHANVVTELASVIGVMADQRAALWRFVRSVLDACRQEGGDAPAHVIAPLFRRLRREYIRGTTVADPPRSAHRNRFRRPAQN